MRVITTEYSFDHAIPAQLHVFSDYREIAPGRWFPFRVESASWLHKYGDDRTGEGTRK